jgi:putative transposase
VDCDGIKHVLGIWVQTSEGAKFWAGVLAELNSKRFRHCGNSASTGISPVPPIHQATRGLKNDRQHAQHMVAGATTGSALTKHRVDVRTGRPHLAANRRAVACVLP